MAEFVIAALIAVASYIVARVILWAISPLPDEWRPIAIGKPDRRKPDKRPWADRAEVEAHPDELETNDPAGFIIRAGDRVVIRYPGSRYHGVYLGTRHDGRLRVREDITGLEWPILPQFVHRADQWTEQVDAGFEQAAASWADRAGEEPEDPDEIGGMVVLATTDHGMISWGNTRSDLLEQLANQANSQMQSDYGRRLLNNDPFPPASPLTAKEIRLRQRQLVWPAAERVASPVILDDPSVWRITVGLDGGGGGGSGGAEVVAGRAELPTGDNPLVWGEDR